VTQLIAAICDNGRSVVTVSDRMISTGDMTLTFEPDQSKAIPITPYALVLTSGTMHEPDLIEDARQRLRGKERVREIGDILKGVYQEIRQTRIEDEILRPLAGIASFSEYHQKQAGLHEALVFDLNSRIQNFEVGLVLILAGVDERGHVLVIGDPGTWTSWDAVGHAFAGMGNRHADSVFAWYKYTQSFNLNEALYIAFEAKTRAEAAGGVGRATDIHIINETGLFKLQETVIQQLEKIYDDRQSRERRGFDQRVTDLQLEKEPLATA
jgi:hypothetical protein